MAQFKEIDDINFPHEIGVLPTREAAFKFTDYLNSKGIKATAKPGFGANYCIYVAEEKDISNAKLELLRFGNNPFAKHYNDAAWQQGRTLKREKVMNSKFMSFTFGTYQWNLISLTSLIEIICLAIYILSFIPVLDHGFSGLLSWVDMRQITENFEVYRVISPIFLHFGILHIAFNLVMFEAFARPIERYFGAFKLLYIILGLAIVSNTLELIFLPSNTIFGGMSGVVYGIIGYMGILSRREDLPYELKLPQGLLVVSVLMIAFGFFLSGMANLCHLGGLVFGLILGLMDFKRQLKNH